MDNFGSVTIALYHKQLSRTALLMGIYSAVCCIAASVIIAVIMTTGSFERIVFADGRAYSQKCVLDLRTDTILML